MTPAPLKLRLTPPVRTVLTELLEQSLTLHDGDRVIDFTGRTPWGDLTAYRHEVHNPLHVSASVPAETKGLFCVEIAPSDVEPIRDVLDAVAESVSGGVPWVALTATERSAVRRLVEQLKH